MSNGKLINEIYLYDGTLDGLFGIVWHCYQYKIVPIHIYENQNYQPNFLIQSTFFPTNPNISETVYQMLLSKMGYDGLYHASYAFLSKEKEKDIAIVKYLLLGLKVRTRGKSYAWCILCNGCYEVS